MLRLHFQLLLNRVKNKLIINKFDWREKDLFKKIILIIILLFLLFLSSCISQRNKRVVLKAADTHDLNYPTTEGLVKMGKLLEEWTAGRIKIQVFSSSQLGSETDTIELTRQGVIDINRVNLNPVTRIVKEMKVLALPYIFRDESHQWKVLSGEVGKELLKLLEPYGLIGLGYYDSGQRSFYNSKKPIKKVDDLKGLKIRVQKADIMVDVIEAVGAIPVEMAFEEVYTGLQTGIIDGAENNEPSFITKGHFESAKYYTYDEHSRVPEIIFMSKITWDKLSDKDKKLIMRAVNESIPYQRKLWKAEVKEAIAKAEASGCEIIRGIDKEPFIKAMEPVYKKHASDLSEWMGKIKAVK